MNGTTSRSTGLPGDLPGRVESADANHLADATDAAFVRDDSYAVVPSLHTAPTPVGPIALQRLRRLLTERELAVLASVDRFRLLTAAQIEQLHFFGHASSETAARIRRRVLERLVAAGMLQRLDRRIGGVRAGSVGYVYRIAPLGYRLVHDEARISGRAKEPGAVFLEHTLEVAKIAIDLVVAERKLHQESTEDWRFEMTTLQPEPECWRQFQKGLSGIEVLKPDLFVAIGLGDYEDRWFCEVDRGTESTMAVLRKCQVYADYFRTDIEQQKFEVFPKVLWIVLTEHRRSLIENAIAKQPKFRALELFVVVTAGDALSTLIGGAL